MPPTARPVPGSRSSGCSNAPLGGRGPPLAQAARSRSVRVMMARSRRADLTALAGYVDREAVQPIVEETYPLEDIGQAHKLTGTGHARGKRVIAVLATP
ncbi:zinc-binding dehydrogenase [Microbispora sp. KK1-11]|uniref:zinc-binding dehydrogenase n=1 Tax=Microbispora sp. KK1-11 TaxID=2053005 RepID=UPI0011597843|nr:zinc-binding dehydrogenase [Microbispora sp. KK1-11]TQS29345.1 zinc-binding dehydrogenase [Microbispora sp. KK1-11]